MRVTLFRLLTVSVFLMTGILFFQNCGQLPEGFQSSESTVLSSSRAVDVLDQDTVEIEDLGEIDEVERPGSPIVNDFPDEKSAADKDKGASSMTFSYGSFGNPTSKAVEKIFHPLSAVCMSGSDSCNNPTGLIYNNGHIALSAPKGCSGSSCLKVNTDAVTSCVDMDYGAYFTGRFAVTYKQTSAALYNDSCSGKSCGLNPGFLVFSSIDKKNWTKIFTDTSTGNAETVLTKYIALPATRARHIRICRGAGSAAHDNFAVTAARLLSTSHAVAAPIDPAVQQVADTKFKTKFASLESSYKASTGVFAANLNGAASPQAKAYTCQVLIGGYRRYGNPLYLQMAKRLADLLVQFKDTNRNGLIGWSLPSDYNGQPDTCSPGQHDAFGDGTCNPAGTEYTLQTDHAAMCLLEVYKETAQANLLTVANQALSDAAKQAEVQVSGCSGCLHYRYSYHKNDAHRIVRNTSAIMARSNALLYSITKDSKLLARVRGIVKAEMREYTSGYKAYVSLYDPAIKKRIYLIDDHYPAMPALIAQVDRILGQRLYGAYVNNMMNDYINCAKDGCKGVSKYSVGKAPNAYTAYVCAAARYSASYKRQCEAQIMETVNFNHPYMGIWLLEALSY